MTIKKAGWAFLAKASVLTAAVVTYSFHDLAKKVDYNVFERKSEIAPGFYQNPAVLDVKWEVNNDGHIETYLINTETKNKIPIMSDMYPSTESMISVMYERQNKDLERMLK